MVLQSGSTAAEGPRGTERQRQAAVGPDHHLEAKRKEEVISGKVGKDGGCSEGTAKKRSVPATIAQEMIV